MFQFIFQGKHTSTLYNFIYYYSGHIRMFLFCNFFPKHKFQEEAWQNSFWITFWAIYEWKFFEVVEQFFELIYTCVI